MVLELVEEEESPAGYRSSSFIVWDQCGPFAFPFNVACQSIVMHWFCVWLDVCSIFIHQ